MIKTLSNRIFLILLFLIIFLVAIFKQPDFKSSLSSFYQKKLFDSFIYDIEANNLDAESYWYFREKFSSGYFSYNQDHIDFLATFRIVKIDDEVTPLLSFTSKNLHSIDALVTQDIIPNLFIDFKEKYEDAEIIADYSSFHANCHFDCNKLLLLRLDKDHYELLFVKPVTEMQRVNGFFDYKSKERDLIKNYYWLNQTSINL